MCLAALRTRCTENIYGRHKQRFPILRAMRSHLQAAQRQIVVCCILHNIADTLSDKGPDQVEDDDDVVEADGDRPLLPPPGLANIDANDAARKRAGEEKQDEVFNQFCVSLNLQ